MLKLYSSLPLGFTYWLYEVVFVLLCFYSVSLHHCIKQRVTERERQPGETYSKCLADSYWENIVTAAKVQYFGLTIFLT